MKKFMNEPENFINETLEGLLSAHPNKLRSVREDNKALVRADAPVENKVAIVTGGGAGHLPLFLGYIGKGMVDGASVGEVFTASSAQQMLDTTKAVESGKGVLYIYGNYSGDVMNFDMAAEMAEEDGIRVETVIGKDDIASMPIEQKEDRRGVAGIFYLYKLAAAKAEQGANLEELKEFTEKVNNQVKTIGVALSPCVLPNVGKPAFTIEEDSMEIGMGIHGEPGIEKGSLQTADEIASNLIEKILQDYGNEKVENVSVLINGLGSTPLEELYIVYRKVSLILKDKGIDICKAYVGQYATSLEMTGLSISLLNTNEEIRSLLELPFSTPFHEQSSL
ncbi:dihydroxyacetone kinase subunit DhaK [Salibacterium aidingense]|uniref:dihydroxyacetone kinase subunit DhaK n=1 Tax=Salibacterium aidingense TaxID=384933 RepID=UPI0004102D8E|nr:dihydroxyacetone kinase subunit DhaK [Salibacterium aidingense]